MTTLFSVMDFETWKLDFEFVLDSVMTTWTVLSTMSLTVVNLAFTTRFYDLPLYCILICIYSIQNRHFYTCILSYHLFTCVKYFNQVIHVPVSCSRVMLKLLVLPWYRIVECSLILIYLYLLIIHFTASVILHLPGFILRYNIPCAFVIDLFSTRLIIIRYFAERCRSVLRVDLYGFIRIDSFVFAIRPFNICCSHFSANVKLMRFQVVVAFVLTCLDLDQLMFFFVYLWNMKLIYSCIDLTVFMYLLCGLCCMTSFLYGRLTIFTFDLISFYQYGLEDS